MGNVLYRMSYSSIIRESQDLGAGLFDRDFNTLCEIELDADAYRLAAGLSARHREDRAARCVEAGRLRDPQPSLFRRQPFARHRHRHAGVLRGRARRLLRQHRASRRHRRGDAGPRHRHPRHVCRGHAAQRPQALRGGRAQRVAVEVHPRQHPRAGPGDGRPRGADRLGRARRAALPGAARAPTARTTVLQATRQLMDYTEGMLRREIAKIPDGDYVAEGFLDDDGRNRGVHLPIKVTVRVRGDGVEVDLTGSSPQVPTAFNVPFEGSTKVACYLRLPGAPPRHLHPRRIHPAERGLVPAGQGDGAAGQHLQPDRAGRGGSPLLPDPAHGRPDHQGARAGAPGQVHRRQRRGAVLRRLFRRAAERRLLGVPRGQRGGDGRPAALRRPGHRSRS